MRQLPPVPFVALARALAAGTALAACAAAVFLALTLAACGGSPDPAGGGRGPTTDASPATAALVFDDDSAPGETPADPPRALWDAGGRARITAAEDRPLDPAAHWPGQRYATRAQLALEELLASPYTVVLEVPDANAVDSALELAEQVRSFRGETDRLGLFVNAKNAADAARVATRLQQEQGWANVFVVH